MVKASHLLLLLSLLFISTQLLAAPDILIKYKNDDNKKVLSQKTHNDRLAKLSSLSKKKFKQQHQYSNHVYAYQSTGALSDGELNTLLGKLNQQSDIDYAEINGRLYPALTPNDTEYLNQWAFVNTISGINIESAWDITTGSNIVIAVLDSGSLAHTDISGRFVSGYDFFSDQGNDLNGNPLDGDSQPGRDSDTTDPGNARNEDDCAAPFDNARNSNWHGLSVSSVIAANTNNNSGIAGVNWSANIMPVRVLARCGGTFSDIADAIRWSAGINDSALPPPPVTPAKVLNLSLSGRSSSCPETLQNAINDAVDAGATIVVAAGNDEEDATSHTPANCRNVITVAASNISGDSTFYTNFGEAIDISAPGGEFLRDQFNNLVGFGIPVLGNNGTTFATTENIEDVSGTSFSAPYVSGVASLMYAVRPDIAPARLENILRLTSRAFPVSSSCSTSNTCGNGLLDAETAVRFAQSNDLFGSSVDTISFTQQATCAIENQGSIPLVLQRTGSGIGDISITYQGIDGTATAGSDFGASDTRIVIWEDGDTDNKTIEIPIVNDTQQEAAEAFIVAISDISPGGVIGSNNNVIITIQSDDNEPALCNNILHAGGKFRLITTSQNVAESIGTVTIDVARTDNSIGEVTLDYRTLAGVATADSDFTATNGTLTWPNGDTANKTISIPITNDTDAESNENFSVELFNNSANTIIVGNTVSTIVIESDETISGSGAQYLLIILLLLIRKSRKISKQDYT